MYSSVTNASLTRHGGGARGLSTCKLSASVIHVVRLFGFCATLLALSQCRLIAAGIPIDRIDLGTFGSWRYSPAFTDQGLQVLGMADMYHLQGGGSYAPGAGVMIWHPTRPSLVTVSGTQIEYTLDVAIGSTVFSRTAFRPDHCSFGELISTDTLVLRAQNGGFNATLSGYAQLIRNFPPPNCSDDHFDPFNAPVGWLVPFNLRYFSGTTWTPAKFDGQFDYELTGTLDFTRAIVPEPASGTLAMVFVAAGFGVWRVGKRRSVSMAAQ